MVNCLGFLIFITKTQFVIFFEHKLPNWLFQVASNAWLCKEPLDFKEPLASSNASWVVNGSVLAEEVVGVNFTLSEGRFVLTDNSSLGNSWGAQHCYTDFDSVLPYPDVSRLLRSRVITVEFVKQFDDEIIK